MKNGTAQCMATTGLIFQINSNSQMLSLKLNPGYGIRS